MIAFKKTLAVDMGTTETRVWLSSKGNVFDEPTLIAINRNGNAKPEIGLLAQKALGRSASDIDVLNPMADGVVADVDLAALFLKTVLDSVKINPRLSGVTVLASCPNRMTKVEQDALVAVFARLHAKKVILYPAGRCTAEGAGIDMASPQGILVLDIGGGISDCAVVAMGNVAYSQSLKIGGNSFTQAIQRYAKNAKNIALGPSSAEAIKKKIASLDENADNAFLEVSGRDVITGLPTTAVISTAEIRPVILPLARQIADMASEVIQAVKPELAADLVTSGILVSGGGALLGGTKGYLEKTMTMPIHFASDMTNAVMLGLIKEAQSR